VPFTPIARNAFPSIIIDWRAIVELDVFTADGGKRRCDAGRYRFGPCRKKEARAILPPTRLSHEGFLYVRQ
jgi:hypothetical protein